MFGTQFSQATNGVITIFVTIVVPFYHFLGQFLHIVITIVIILNTDGVAETGCCMIQQPTANRHALGCRIGLPSALLNEVGGQFQGKMIKVAHAV